MTRSLDSFARTRTFRWNDGERVDAYEAVEATAQDLTWYTWSHAPSGGKQNVQVQSHPEYFRLGPPRPVPATVIRALDAWIESMHPHRSGV